MIVGLDLGGTKIRAGVVADGAVVGGLVQRPTPPGDGEAVLDTMVEVIRAVVGTGGTIGGLGVAATGVIDQTSGVVMASTSTLDDWHGVDIVAGLRRRLGDQRLPIATMNDVNAYAEAEAWRGAARGVASALIVAAGTGIGGALIVAGQVWRGAHWSAGEIGHIPLPGAESLQCLCGCYGHLETVASGKAVERDYRRRTGRALTGAAIAARAATDPAAGAALETAGRALGRGLAGVVMTIDPEVIILGGGLSQAGGMWLAALDQALRAELVGLIRTVPLIVSDLGDAAPIIGATRGVVAAVR